ncbi:MAG: outer membrane protein assembly factor [Gammaproteobacteria bacterium]|nr:outer membrane protein assembly factor [Gammaproteobacteria bacterium]
MMRIREAIGLFLCLLLCSTVAFGWSIPFINGNHGKKSVAEAKGEKISFKIDGLSENATKNAMDWLQLDQKRINRPLTTDDVKTLYANGGSSILQAAQPFGFFKAKIIRSSLKSTGQHQWTAQYYVTPGVPLRVTSFSIVLTGEGANQPFFHDYLKKLPLKQGQVLQTENYNTIKKTVNNIATQHGFLSGHFTTNVIKIDLASYTSDIELVYDTGPQYYFGQVFFKKNSLNNGFLQRFVRFKQGQPYSPDALLTLQQNLSTTPYFKSVDVEPGTQNEQTKQVPVNVTLTPSKSQKYNFGIGYGTDTGIRGTVGWTFPRVTKDGDYFVTNLQASQIQTNLEARYIMPGSDPTTQQYYIAASITQESPNTSEGHTEKLRVGKSDVWYGWKANLSLSEQFDQYSLRGDPWLNSYLLLPELSLTKSVFDDPIFPMSGHSLSFKLRGAAEPLLSSTSFVQSELAGNYIFSPTSSSRLLIRGDLGLTVVNDINTIPLSLQFFAGGSDSVRGYSYQELGPGKYLLVGSVEYQHEIIEKWYAAIFYDAGNAVNSLTNPEGTAVGVDQPNINLSALLKQCVGIGAVWASPVGPMEITLAKPLNDSSKSVSIQFSMGTGL